MQRENFVSVMGHHPAVDVLNVSHDWMADAIDLDEFTLREIVEHVDAGVFAIRGLLPIWLRDADTERLSHVASTFAEEIHAELRVAIITAAVECEVEYEVIAKVSVGGHVIAEEYYEGEDFQDALGAVESLREEL